MKKTAFLMSFVICLAILNSIAFAIIRDNLEVKKISNELAGVQYSSECFSECHLPLRIKWLGSDISLQKSELKYYKTKVEGLDTIESVNMKYLTKQNVNEWVSDISCETQYTMNLTPYEDCIDNGHFEVIEKLVWKSLPSNIPIKANEWYYIDIIAKRTPSLIKSGIDIVPEIKGIMFPEMDWFNTSWTKKQPIDVWVDSGTTERDFPIGINVTHDFSMKNDFGDLRFTNSTEDSELCYWVQEKSDGEWAFVWLNVDSNISTTNYTPYMYYGNPLANTTSNINCTFPFGDDFEDDIIDTDKWTVTSGSPYEANGIVNCTIFVNGTSCWLNGDVDILDPLIIEMRMNWNKAFGHRIGTNIGWREQAIDRDCILIDNATNDVIEPSCSESADGGGRTQGTGFVISETVWAKVKMIINESEARFYKDGQYTGLVLTNVPNGTAIPLSMLINGGGGGQSGWFAWDWAFIRKYFEPEPNYEFGPEEPEGIDILVSEVKVHKDFFCFDGNSVYNETIIQNNTSVSTLTYDYCDNGCNEENLIITVFDNEPSLCNPNEWLQWITFSIVIIIIIYLLFLRKWKK